jgi:hypothetical protein
MGKQEDQFQGSSYGTSGGQNSTGRCFPSRTAIFSYQFKVCKSVHHRKIQINHKPDETVFQFIILAFIYSSTRFGRFPAHHQELNDCSGSLWFYLCIVVTAVLCSWSGRQNNKLENCCSWLVIYLN